MARKYQHVQALLPQIKEMLAAGMTQSEVEKELGLTGDRPIHNLLKQERRRERKLMAGAEIRPKGRPRKDGKSPHENPQKEIERLRMENKLLRDFLSLIERK